MSFLLATTFALTLPRYRIVDLGVDAEQVTGGRTILINNTGVIAGNAYNVHGDKAFMISGGKLRRLHGLRQNDWAVVSGVTEQGKVYGSAYSAGNAFAAIWVDGVAKKLDAVPRNTSFEEISYMNDRGDMVGQGQLHHKHSTERFSFWRARSKRLRKIPGELTEPDNLLLTEDGILYGLTNRPQDNIGPSSEIAFRYDGRSWKFIDPEMSQLSEVNSHGDIAGSYMVDADGADGCLWHNGKRFDIASHVNGLNKACDAVGDHLGYWESNKHGAFLWRNELSTPLESLVGKLGDWQLSNASDINDKGEIVGVGLKSGRARYFLLEPVR